MKRMYRKKAHTINTDTEMRAIARQCQAIGRAAENHAKWAEGVARIKASGKAKSLNISK